MPRLVTWKKWMLVAGAMIGATAAVASDPLPARTRPSANVRTNSPQEFRAGPLWQDFRLTLTEGHRTEVVAPLFYHEVAEENDYHRETWSLAPLFTRSIMDDIDVTQTDIFWKFISYNTYGDEYRFQIVQLFSLAGGGTQGGTNVHRFTLFPIYFQQRSAIPEKNYTALLPLYGTLRNRLSRDEIQFVGFPVWARTRKKDVTTDNYLYPVFHLRYGPHLRGWQVWPLLGAEHRDFSTLTNVWGDPEPVPGHRKLFVLWPFFAHHHLGLGTTNEGRAQALLPIYSWQRSPTRDSTTFPWPLGYTHTIEREKQFEEWGAPWPLIVFARGPGKHVNRVWPFFSHGTNKTLTSTWYGWPVYKYNRLHSDPLDRERTRILFFLYSDTQTHDTVTKREKRRIDIWPLLSATRELDGSRRLQFIAPLEPLLPGNTSLQRDLSLLWSVWRSEKNPQAGRSSQSFLWNLWRRDVTPNTRKGSLLFGLFQYESGTEGKRGRVFFIPYGRRHAGPAPDATAPK